MADTTAIATNDDLFLTRKLPQLFLWRHTLLLINLEVKTASSMNTMLRPLLTQSITFGKVASFLI